ncbi:uncharacterized protein batf2 isoform X2 [Channa argus]|uniref:uncharacterized protein batf2 isoform X2 n=1 Tax=Channa argus TaxID=215402 RepID=UPI00352096E7
MKRLPAGGKAVSQETARTVCPRYSWTQSASPPLPAPFQRMIQTATPLDRREKEKDPSSRRKQGQKDERRTEMRRERVAENKQREQMNFMRLVCSSKVVSAGAAESGAIKLSPPKGNCSIEKRLPPVYDSSGIP